MPWSRPIMSAPMIAVAAAAPDCTSAAVPYNLTGSRSVTPIVYISPAKA
jgi:hypothetical protein